MPVDSDVKKQALENKIASLEGELKALRKKPRDCQLCANPKAVGKYYVHPEESENHGWWRVCVDCADVVSHVGANVEYYAYVKLEVESLPEHVLSCSHDWDKWSLVGEMDNRRGQVFDWMRCKKCMCYGKRFGLTQMQMEDLTMEIDLSCSR